MATKKETYTYAQMVEDLQGYVEVSEIIPTAKKAQILDKLAALAESYSKKSAYAATHRKPSQAKGPGEATKELAAKVAEVLGDVPMTSAEIAEALGLELSPLRIANAAKYIPGVVSQKVVRTVIGKDGLKAERQYTGYFIA